jgi:hypothetical protein
MELWYRMGVLGERACKKRDDSRGSRIYSCFYLLSLQFWPADIHDLLVQTKIENYHRWEEQFIIKQY